MNPEIKTKLPKGVRVDIAQVIEITDHSGVNYNERKEPHDVAALFRLKIPGLDFNPEVYVGGNLSNSGWGSAFRVRMSFEALGIPRYSKLNGDGQIPAEWLEQGLGKHCLRLRYCRGQREGKLIWGTYFMLGKLDAYAQSEDEHDREVESAVAKFVSFFLTQVERGFVRDFAPHAIHQAPQPPPATEEPASSARPF